MQKASARISVGNLCKVATSEMTGLLQRSEQRSGELPWSRQKVNKRSGELSDACDKGTNQNCVSLARSRLHQPLMKAGLSLRMRSWLAPSSQASDSSPGSLFFSWRLPGSSAWPPQRAPQQTCHLCGVSLAWISHLWSYWSLHYAYFTQTFVSASF